MEKLPDFQLSSGQVLWCLSNGRVPKETLFDEVNYFRKLGIPFGKKKIVKGRGNRLTYGFYELLELALVFELLKRGLKKSSIHGYVLRDRDKLRQTIEKAYFDQPGLIANSLKADEIENILIENECWLRVYDRDSEEPGKIEYPKREDVRDIKEYLRPIERMPDGSVRELLPLTKLIFTMVALAKAAPVITPGPLKKQSG